MLLGVFEAATFNIPPYCSVSADVAVAVGCGLAVAVAVTVGDACGVTVGADGAQPASRATITRIDQTRVSLFISLSST